MVFPSLSFSVDAGLVSQMSTLVVIGFSIFLNYWKKALIYILVFISVLVAVGIFSSNAFSFAAVNGTCGTMCANNQNYFGTPMTYNRPAYYYPQLQYHSFWGPRQSYFNSHTPSPYAPSSYYNCPHCNQQNQYPFFQNQGGQGWNTIMPQNNQNHGPGMPMS
jgi:hypothetical protein